MDTLQVSIFLVDIIEYECASSDGVSVPVREQRVHEVRWTSALDRPKRSGDRRFKSVKYALAERKCKQLMDKLKRKGDTC